MNSELLLFIMIIYPIRTAAVCPYDSTETCISGFSSLQQVSEVNNLKHPLSEVDFFSRVNLDVGRVDLFTCEWKLLWGL